jgi:DNA replication protein DnaC
MLHQPTLDKLQELKLAGMLRAYQEQEQLPDCQALSFEERLGLLVDRELTERANRRLATRLRFARLRQDACLEDIDFRHPRGLDRSVLLSLADCRWIAHHDNCVIVGPFRVKSPCARDRRVASFLPNTTSRKIRGAGRDCG